MPDPFGDNEALSQDALDALVNSVSDAEASTSPAASEPDAATASAAQAEPSVDGTAPDAEAEEEEEYVDPFEAARKLKEATAALHMTSFDSSAEDKSPPKELQGFERVQDIPLELTVELGRTRLLIKDILELRAGSIVELEKMAGEPVDILANGLLVARGEVVVIEDAFGVRITEIVTSAERKALTSESTSTNAA